MAKNRIKEYTIFSIFFKYKKVSKWTKLNALDWIPLFNRIETIWKVDYHTILFIIIFLALLKSSSNEVGLNRSTTPDESIF